MGPAREGIRQRSHSTNKRSINSNRAATIHLADVYSEGHLHHEKSLRTASWWLLRGDRSDPQQTAYSDGNREGISDHFCSTLPQLRGDIRWTVNLYSQLPSLHARIDVPRGARWKRSHLTFHRSVPSFQLRSRSLQVHSVCLFTLALTLLSTGMLRYGAQGRRLGGWHLLDPERSRGDTEIGAWEQ